MTKDEILKMPAGREMDALIAKHVMGTSPRIVKREYSSGFELISQDWKEVVDRELAAMRHYSTDIAAAWQVVEKIPGAVSLQRMDSGASWRAWYQPTPGSFSAWTQSETAPLAICHAALLAMMEAE